jgi:subtilisin family serine protease
LIAIIRILPRILARDTSIKWGDGSHGACWVPADAPEETHATHVAGTILGANNSVGIYGVAFNARLHHARVLGPDGGSTADIMDGVRWLVDTEGVKVVNLSLGGRLPSRTEEKFYNEVFNKGVLVVAATGNDGMNRLSFPAGYAVNIAVGAVDRTNALASFSNTGRFIDIVGPGVAVLSSVPPDQGTEASVVAGSSNYGAFGMEFAGRTAGITRTLVNCGLAQSVADCPATVAGNIALIRRGTNTFGEKVTNAMDAGAAAAIVYNNVSGDLLGTLGDETTADGRAWIPAIGVSDTIGAALLSQVGNSVTVINVGTSWDTFEGTSMATPHVAGTIALMWGANPALSHTTIQNYLLSTATDLGAAGYDRFFGYGIVNALSAVKKAAGIP